MLYPRRTFVNTTAKALSEKNLFSLGGLNYYAPDELMDDSDSPYARNFRIFKDSALSSRVCISKRDGRTFYTVPVGETDRGSQTSVTGASTVTVGSINWLAQKFTVSAAGRLTKVTLNLENINSGTAPLLVDIYNEVSSAPGVKLASSSISQSSITGSLAYQTVRFIEAPQVATSTNYYIVIHQQTEGTGTYTLSTTTNSTLAMTSSSAGNAWTAAAYSLNYHVFVSTDSPLKSFYRFYRSSAGPVTLLVVGTTLYSVNDSTGALTSISTALNTAATNYRWTTIQDVCYFVNGVDVPKKYDGTTLSDVGGTPGVSIDLVSHKDRLWLLNNDGKVVYSDPAAYETFGLTSFVYAFPPKSADQAFRITVFQDNVVGWSKNDKAIISGSDISNIVNRQSTASHGVVGPDALTKYGNYVYFIGKDDIYSFNGGSDTGMGIKIDRILENVADLATMKLVVHKGMLRIYYTPSGEGFNSRCLIYDTTYKKWLDDDGIYCGEVDVFNSQTDEDVLVEASSLVGALYYGETGTSDLGKPILFDYWTKYHSFGFPTRKHRIKRLYPHFRPTDTNYNCTVSVDADDKNAPINSTLVPLGASGTTWGGGALWGGGATWGAGTISPQRIQVPGQARKHQIRFAQYGVDNPVEIIGYTVYYQIGKII